MSIINSAICENVRHAQAKAEIMMRRRDPYNNSIAKEIHQDWYFTGVEDICTAPSPVGGTKATEFRKVRGTGQKTSSLKKRLPHYLTSSGSVLSAALEVNNEKVYCVPGQKSSRPKSMFLTGQESPTTSSERKRSSSHRANVSPCWQPLTTAALLEHTTVSEIPVKGPGHHAHGHYTMWKPNNIHH